MATQDQRTCHLRQTLKPDEALPLMGLNPLQIQEKISILLDAFQSTSETDRSWNTAIDACNNINAGYTTYTSQPDNGRQLRDSELLSKRFDVLQQTILKGLFPPGTLNIHFIPAGTTEWNRNHQGPALDGYAYSNRRDYDTTPSTFTATIFVYEKPRIRCNATRMKVTTGNLLHELLHAILEAYACVCPLCWKNVLEGEGLTGHGPVWMALSRKIEKTMLRVFGYRCWLGRSQSLAHEHHAARHVHTEEELTENEVNERLYCEARMDFAQDDMRSGVSFHSVDFAAKDDKEGEEGTDSEEGLESDYSEDEDETFLGGSG